MPVAWTPDGRRIVFWGQEKGGHETLLSIRPDGTDVREFVADLPSDARALSVDWSEDGRWIVAAGPYDLAAVGGSPSHVYLIRADGGDVFAIAAGGSEPAWRPTTP
jgi:Tol biopolymer transport system component